MPNNIEDFRFEKNPEQIRQNLKERFSKDIASVTAALKFEADQSKNISEVNSDLSLEDNK